MLLRIQTAFLSIATMLSVFFLFKPFSSLYMNDGTLCMLTFAGLKTAEEPIILLNLTFPLSVLAITTGLLSLVTIFLYSNRVLQLRLCVLNILLTLGFLLALAFYYLAFKNGIGLAEGTFAVQHRLRWTLIIPIINIILIFQAFRAIRRDDLLMKSYDRLR